MMNNLFLGQVVQVLRSKLLFLLQVGGAVRLYRPLDVANRMRDLKPSKPSKNL